MLDTNNRDDITRAAHRMREVGGSFAAAIAQAWFVADATNRNRLIFAFDDLFERFHVPQDNDQQ